MVDLTKRLCGNCGARPCYHLCFNSPYFYSPEQERYDDQFYGEDDHRERYAAELADLELEALYDGRDGCLESTDEPYVDDWGGEPVTPVERFAPGEIPF